MDVSHWWRVFLMTFDQNHDQKCGKVWHWRHHAKGICSTRTNGKWKILLCRSEMIEGKHPAQTFRQVAKLQGPATWQRSSSCVAHCASVLGFYKDDSHPPPRLLTRSHPLWFFSCSWRRNWNSRGEILTALKRSRMYHRKWWRHWQEMTSRSASDDENPAGITVSMPKGTTLRGMRRTEVSLSG